MKGGGAVAPISGGAPLRAAEDHPSGVRIIE
jgi:hypothetical protein